MSEKKQDSGVSRRRFLKYGGAAVVVAAAVAGGAYYATRPPATTSTTVAPPTTTATVAPLTTSTTVAPATKTPLTLWHLWATGSAQLDWLTWAVNKFNAENPGASVNPVYVENELFKKQIVTAMSAGNPPDIFHNWGGYMYLFRFSSHGLVADLTPYMSKESPYIAGVPWKETLLPGRMAQCTFTDGKIYGVPLAQMFESYFFNTKLFKDYGVTMPTNDWTLDDLKGMIGDIKRKVAGKQIYPIALGNSGAWTGMIYYMHFVLRLAGAPYVEQAIWKPDMRFDTQPFVQAGATCQELVDAGAFNPGFNGLADTDAAELFASGKAFMENIGNWIYGQALSYNKDNPQYFDVVAPPHLPNEKDSVNMIGGGDAYALASTCKDVDDAAKFLQLLVSPESQVKNFLDVQMIPPIKMDYLGLSDQQKAAITPLMQHEMELLSKANYICNYWDQGLPPTITAAVLDSMVSLFGKTMTPEQCAAKLETARQQWLKEAGIT
jgi:raffinose/stachyose/melibiose transport system substrate-binding protein